MADVDPLRSFNFTLMIEGVNAGRFVECSGIGANIDIIAFREGGSNLNIRHLPGQTRYQPMTLRHGVSKSPDLWRWFEDALTGDPTRRNISVVMFTNDRGAEAFRWNLFGAWVSTWRAAPLDASVSEVAIDSMQVIYDRLERD